MSAGGADLPSEVTAPDARALRLALAGFLFGTTGMFAAMYSTQPILPALARHFDRSEAEAGLTISVVVFTWGSPT
jgi:predicted MFS family arabinose efflux permease